MEDNDRFTGIRLQKYSQYFTFLCESAGSVVHHALSLGIVSIFAVNEPSS